MEPTDSATTDHDASDERPSPTFSGLKISASLLWVISGILLIIFDLRLSGIDVLFDTVGKILIAVGIVKIIGATRNLSLSSLRIALVFTAVSLPLNIAADGIINMTEIVATGLGVAAAAGIFYFSDAMHQICQLADVPIASKWRLARVLAGLMVVGSLIQLLAAANGTPLMRYTNAPPTMLIVLLIAVVLAVLATVFWLLQRTRSELRAIQ